MADFSTAVWSVTIPGVVIIVAVALWLSIIDWREHRLPNRIVGPLAGGVALWVLLLGFVASDLGRGVTAIGWGMGASAAFFVLNLVAGLGMGDVKFAFPVGATLGWFGADSVEIGFYAMVVSAGVVGLAALVQGKGRDHRVAFGPYMAFGLLCGIARGVIG